MQEEAAQAKWTEAQHRTFGDFGTFKSSTPPGEQDPKPNLKAQGPPPAGPPPPPPPPQSSPGFNPWARPRPFGPRPMPFSPWASYQAPLPPHLWPEAFFRMTHHLAMHNILNKLTAYIFFTLRRSCVFSLRRGLQLVKSIILKKKKPQL